MIKKALIVVAHGSKKSKSNEEFVELCEKIRCENSSKFHVITYAFLEFETPNIAMAIENMSNKSIDKLYIYPYFLNYGKHVSVDIPNIISDLEKFYTNIDIELLNHFGSSKKIASIISDDLKLQFSL
ncbi:MAG: CbiX/SirB N-terminal domain-containing protein [Campylobacterota bacterium]|nr:CbiX/SirB N-terminal domain-containing protein [Campylobacterota bacterium]